MKLDLPKKQASLSAVTQKRNMTNFFFFRKTYWSLSGKNFPALCICTYTHTPPPPQQHTHTHTHTLTHTHTHSWFKNEGNNRP